ncbi:OPT/YSL family transporter [Polyangium sp. 15x6]|uniref:OPT/YSL family transporter n=1 Tax=Polyangium sp. 15x6 TaxID=3042687 RepID=UPI00249C040C|nr:OPT/YSL family transporter [Polyangium sp. 15x6]MDI3283124.1 OPT/YSL family transporter [Polyangium sp. 15x6]
MTTPSPAAAEEAPRPKFAFLPKIDTPAYHALLSAVAILVLGPLGGIAAAYMNFSLGFFVGGQVLAGILGSAVTYGYGPEGKHGANYMQTMAASVAGMAGMGVLIQAMTWLGIPMPPWHHLALYFACIGMFGVGLGMVYTPILVDRLKLDYPSGYAVANILRALTDKRLLKRSIGQLGGGTGAGVVFAALVEKLPAVGATQLSASTIGAGMVVGARIAIPALLMGLIGKWITPYLVSIGWLKEGESFRKIGFLIALAMILGAAVVDMSLIAVEAVRRVRAQAGKPMEADAKDAWKQVNPKRLVAWIVFWAAALVAVSTLVMGQPITFTIFAILLTSVFVLINGISLGISDSNPISSAFVIAVLLMSGLGLKDPRVGLMSASILLVACSVGGDMQQDRSTGYRLGTNRTVQFRYQSIGILMGAVLCVVLAQTFMKAYPVLTINSFADPKADVGQWQSAMTFKFVGALQDIGYLPTYKVKALAIGLAIGIGTEILRKVIHASERYKNFVKGSKEGFATGFVVDAFLLPSPYASSFGGFVELMVCVWFAVGGVGSSAYNTWQKSMAAKQKKDGEDLPEDMSTTSLVGGGLIAGEALYALAVGLHGLFSNVLLKPAAATPPPPAAPPTSQS